MTQHCLQAEETGPKEAADKTTSEEDARTAAFTTWTQYDVQVFCAEVERTMQDVGANEGGRFPKATVLALAAKIPAAVVVYYPAVMAAINVVEEHEEDMVANTEARQALGLLRNCGREAEGFWLMQTGGATASSANDS